MSQTFSGETTSGTIQKLPNCMSPQQLARSCLFLLKMTVFIYHLTKTLVPGTFLQPGETASVYRFRFIQLKQAF